MFRVGDEFNSFDDLRDKISTFGQTQFVQLYIRRSRTIIMASKRRTKKIYNEDLKFAELEYACINGGKNFKTTSTGERPNQQKVEVVAIIIMIRHNFVLLNAILLQDFSNAVPIFS